MFILALNKTNINAEARHRTQILVFRPHEASWNLDRHSYDVSCPSASTLLYGWGTPLPVSETLSLSTKKEKHTLESHALPHGVFWTPVPRLCGIWAVCGCVSHRCLSYGSKTPSVAFGMNAQSAIFGKH